MLYVVFVFEMKLNHLFFVFRPFFEGMSHSSSQTEIGSIHSQKSQQRELSCPVSLLPGTLFKKKQSDAFERHRSPATVRLSVAELRKGTSPGECSNVWQASMLTLL